MRLNAPKVITFWVAVILALFGFIAAILPIDALVNYAAYIVFLGFVVLALGNLLKGF